jgi:protein-disulfide isomerase
MNTRIVVALLAMISLSVGCTAAESGKSLSDDELRAQVEKVIKENPSIVLDVIKENPVEFVDALQGAVDKARETYAKEMAAEQEKKREKLIEEAFANPLQPAIREDEAIRGNKEAPLLLVEYSDFECPYCSRGFTVVQGLQEKYGDQLKFVYKHLPLLGMHKNAELAARYYEGLRLQDHEKAFTFHDALFAEQQRLTREGEAFLIELAKSTGADMKRLAVDVKSEEVGERINADMQEAAAFGFGGTPAYVLNGIPVFGAYPQEHFESIIAKLQERGKVTLSK